MSKQQPFFSPLHHQLPAIEPATSFRRDEAEAPIYDAPPWVLPEWFAPPVGVSHVDCDMCGYPIEPRETAAEIFVGKVGRNWKNGSAMVITDHGVAEANRVTTLHLECVSAWAFEIYGDQEPVVHCTGCGDELEPLCEECCTRRDQDFGED